MRAAVQGEGMGDYQVGQDGTVERVVTVPKALDSETMEKVGPAERFCFPCFSVASS
jgi:hypothetical protein